MNRSLFLLIGALLLGIAIQSKAQDAVANTRVADLTAEGLFTAGIEGPCVGIDGSIYVVNFDHQGTIGKVSPTGRCELFIELPEGSIGNGIRIDQMGFLYIADYTGHNVLKIHPQTREINVFAHNELMNQPNDLAIASNGTLYCSDPNWKEGTGNLWRIDPDGKSYLLMDKMGTTNGIELNPAENKLYVNESVQRNVWQFDVVDGELSNKRLLISFEDFGFDGMRCDSEGNLYITRHGKGTVVVVNPEGEILREIKLVGSKPSNIAFGGKDGRTCYITLQDRGNIECFRASNPGRSFNLIRSK